MSAYVGRFAPSPSGPLHAGSLVAAVASYLDARAHGGRWLVRIEDVDEARTVPGAADEILRTLEVFGMRSDGEVWWQSRRGDVYAAAFARLQAQGMVYPCACSRREIADSQLRLAPAGLPLSDPTRLVAPTPAEAARTTAAMAIGSPASSALPYPGTCRHGMPAGRAARAWRVRVPAIGADDAVVTFDDRACGPQRQDLAHEAGDFVLKRADGFWAYQLAVVVDDAEQGVTDVVRGMDLLDSTPRQIWLQRLLGHPAPRYLHAPLVRNANGEKLSKQTGAAALDVRDPVGALVDAAQVLGLALDLLPDGPCAARVSVEDFWRRAVPLWATRHGLR